MKTVLAALLLSTLATTVAVAQPAQLGPQPEPTPAPAEAPVAPRPERTTVAITVDAPGQDQPAQQAPQGQHGQPTASVTDGGWHAPVGRRFLHGFRLGYSYTANFDKPTRKDGTMSLKDEFGIKTPNMMLLGYEGFYRIVGHSWLNVLLVGNVTVAGLEQSKFIPAASGLIGFEFDQSFQLGVGVNLTPDAESPTHMIAAAGWTPSVGAIQMPVHFFIVPDTEKNHRMGVTVGVTW